MDHDYYVPCFPRAALQVFYGFRPVWGYRHQAPRHDLSYLFDCESKAIFNGFVFHVL